MSNVMDVVDGWVLATLLANDDIEEAVDDRVYDTQAPKGATYPLIVFHHQSTDDSVVVSSYRVFSTILVTVRAIVEGEGYGAGREIASAIDEALHGKRGSTTDGVVLGCVRERPIKLPPETVGDVKYWAIGGVYRVYAKEGG